MTVRCPRRRVFHVHRPAFYYTEDSVRGIETAVARGFPWIDLDCQVTADGVLVVAHGPRPLSWRLTGGFEDPGCDLSGRRPHVVSLTDCPEVTRRDRFEDLTWAQVSRLRSTRPGVDGRPYRIRRADELVPIALKKGLRVELEVKSSKITQAQLAAIGDVPAFKQKGVSLWDVQVKGFPKFLPALLAAHRAGYTTIALTHPGQRHLPTSARPCIDMFRGMTPIWDQSR